MPSESAASLALQNRKYTHFLFCFLPHVQFALLAAGLAGGGYWLLLSTVFLLIIVPSLDHLTGWQDGVQVTASDFSTVETSLLAWNTRLYALFYVVSLCVVISRLRGFSSLEIALLIPALGLLSVIGFAAAHELLHSRKKIDQHLQTLLTIVLFYPHYQLIHLRSHHVHVGTPEDQNTAWHNEGIYRYLLRTIPGSAAKCWQIEAKRLAASGNVGWRAILRNKMTAYALAQFTLLLGLALYAGAAGVLFYLVQTVFSHLVLESVNYMQHYGLLRQMQGAKFEKTKARHSWDTYHFFSSYVTFRVGHHASHHMAVKPYYLLGIEEPAPQLPVGYFLAILMVFLPPWWRHTINPKLPPASRL